MGGTTRFGTVFDLLGDNYTREILRVTSTEPKGVKEMSRELDVARSTIYRRVNRLVDLGFLHEQTKTSLDGHHYTVYEAAIERLTIEIENGELGCQLHPSDDAASRFTKLMEGMSDI
ncbi:winged helix-turn-helix domain-containing protein [Natrinema halophilum]|uniref:Winged helix-turn-helix transcriptional regulator n=1 Tax=Natrinema halophilum TaxID=1699371 RepID=A0A7D5KCC9_9EURY